MVCGSLKSGIRRLYWFNHLRIRGALDYRSPAEYRLHTL
ncbi:IS3 family transposase [Butyricicoccus sp. Marseille-Q5471]